MIRFPRASLVLLAGVLLCTAHAEDFEKESLALRTALHHNAGLELPLERLVDLHRDSGRLPELVDLYRAHVVQYPGDPGGRAVLVRVLAAAGDSDAVAASRVAVEVFPENGLLWYLLAELLGAQRDPGAADALAKAAIHAATVRERVLWLGELFTITSGEGRGELARSTVQQVAGNFDAATRVGLARRALDAGLPEIVGVLLSDFDDGGDAELKVAAGIVRARAGVASGDLEGVSALLEGLLDKVSGDYWRRGELVRLQLEAAGTEEERAALIGKAEAAVSAEPESEAAVVGYAGLLEASGRRREALASVLAGIDRIPGSARLEARAIELLQRVPDAGEAVRFFEARLAADPAREGLRGRLAESLFLAGKTEKGLAEAGKLPAAARLRLARALRRGGLSGSAAEVFAIADVAAGGDEFGIRGEWAEALVAAGRRGEVKAVFSDEVLLRAGGEAVESVARFFLANGFWSECKEFLEAGGGGFTAGLLLAETYAKLGDENPGLASLATHRAEADSAARYGSWLMAAAAFHEVFGTLEEFFAGESGRFVGDPAAWDEGSIEKFLTLGDVAVRYDEGGVVAGVVREKIGISEIGENVGMLRFLVGMLDPVEDAAELEVALAMLVAADPARETDYALRRVVLFARDGRADLVMGALDGIVPARGTDAGILRPAVAVMYDFGRVDLALQSLERLTELEPENLPVWEQWVTCLAATGDEPRLRVALRRLLGGAGGSALGGGAYDLLRGHLAASFWRTVVRGYLRGEQGAGDARLALDGLARERPGNPAVAWARGLLGGGGPGASSAFIEAAGDGPLVEFPGGMALSVDTAARLIAEPGIAGKPGLRGPLLSDGPVKNVQLDWIFTTGESERIVQTLDLGSERIAVVDSSGKLTVLNALSGKLLWEKAGAVAHPVGNRAGRPARGMRGGMVPVDQVKMPGRIDTGDNLIFVAGAGTVKALGIGSGNTRWVADLQPSKKFEVNGTRPASEPVAAELYYGGGKIVAVLEGSSSVFCFDAVSGRQLWGWEAGKGGGAPERARSPLTSGAALSGDRLAVFGREPVVLETRTGNVLWRFAPEGEIAFPPELGEPLEIAPGTLAAPPREISALSFLHLPDDSDPAFANFIKEGGPVLSPAAQWASAAHSGAPSAVALGGGYLVLAGKDGASFAVPEGLPVGGRAFRAPGVLVGVSGGKGVFLDRTAGGFWLVDLAAGTPVLRKLPAEISVGKTARIEAGLAGARAYVATGKGIAAINVLTGSWLFEQPWPEGTGEITLRPPRATPGDLAAGIVETPTRGAPVCLPPRILASGKRLFVPVDGGRLLGLVER